MVWWGVGLYGVGVIGRSDRSFVMDWIKINSLDDLPPVNEKVFVRFAPVGNAPQSAESATLLVNPKGARMWCNWNWHCDVQPCNGAITHWAKIEYPDDAEEAPCG